MFDSLSDRLQSALAGLRGKGKLTEADINATAREIRLALLEADGQRHVGFQQREADLASGGIDISLGQFALTAQARQG